MPIANVSWVLTATANALATKTGKIHTRSPSGAAVERSEFANARRTVSI